MEYLSVLSPLVAFIFAFLFGKQLGNRGAQFITCAGVILAAICSCVLFVDVAFYQNVRTITLFEWINVGDFNASWDIRLDTLSVVMMCVITIVSSCVHVYSIGYMSHDAHKARFMSYLSLFTFAMLMLVTADNLLQLFFGWEGVGLASYLLIGFWNYKQSANSAAMKAFIVNRVGDFGLVLGIFTIFMLFGTIDFDEIFAVAPEKAEVLFNFLGYELHALTLAGLLLFIGACGKSAQLGLHTWLPDAMEGPTPVSALIHAATMVTAGIFLVARFSPVYEYAPDALMVICVVGATTAFVAATIGMTQFDIKRVIAYSTMSQLGYMFFALGVSAYGAAMFHLVTHAFFKALLFLGAGSVIHAMSDEQDMRKMGGIYKMIPMTYILMWIGSLALAGIPFFAGYYSKDMILEAAWADNSWFGHYAYWMGIAAALMTAFYSWRLIIMTFHGKPNASKEVMSHVHESPKVMIMPLLVLAAGAIFSGYALYGGFVGSAHHGEGHSKSEYHAEAKAQGGHHEEEKPHTEKTNNTVISWDKDHFWGESIKVLPENDTVEAAHNVPKWVKKLPIGVAALGILLAYFVYMWRAGIAAFFVKLFKPLHALFFNKWYFDELYNTLFKEGSIGFGRLFSRSDKTFIDGLGPDGLSKTALGGGGILSKFQTGFVYQYAFIMMVGLIAIISWIVFGGTF